MQAVKLIAVAALVLGAMIVRGQGVAATPTRAPGLSAEQRAAGFAYGPSVSAVDRQLIDGALAGAHPSARALIEQIDGITTLEVGAPPNGAAGVASGNVDGFTVTLDLGGVQRGLGPRGVSRLVLHELGHVVYFVLVPPELADRLDRSVPTCLGGAQPGCADPAERFAETFAKWAMSDIGVNLYIGYAVPPPADLEAWAAPLAELQREPAGQ